MLQQTNSAKQFIYNLSLAKEDSAILFGNFLDDFHRAAPKMRIEILLDEPETFKSLRPIEYVNTTTTVHKLANDTSIPVPLWVSKEKYYAKEPYFPVHHSDLKLIYMYESPTELKHRNMFVSANALARV